MKPGIFIFEGVDFTGKTGTVRYVKEELEKLYPGKVKAYRNPGGTALGEKVRDIARIETDDVEEQFLAYFLAITSVHNQVKKDIQDGCIVLLDRWVQSTLAYQVMMMEEDKALFNELLQRRFYPEEMHTIFFDLSLHLLMERKKLKASERQDTVDRFEAADYNYQLKIWTNYQAIMQGRYPWAKAWPSKNVFIDSAKLSEEEQKKQCFNLILEKVQ